MTLFRNTFIFVFIIFSLSACSVFKITAKQHGIVNVSVDGQDRIRFSGKGAGAGMMLMSSMGPAGIAIGVAIDEGIGKDIHTAFSTHGQFSTIVESETQAWLAEVCSQQTKRQTSLCNESSVLTITIHRYGFHTTSGDNDPVVAELDISFSFPDKTIEHLMLKSLEEQLTKAPLESLKTDGNASKTLLMEGYRLLLKQLNSELFSEG